MPPNSRGTLLYNAGFWKTGEIYMFCSKCGSLLLPTQAKDGMVMCKCGHREPVGGGQTIMTTQKKKEVEDCPVVDGIEGVMPRTNVPCPKCSHNEAYWYLRQTRKSDEPETTFLTCCKCGHKWRKY